ncbi:MAG: aminopeptidase N, partial [Notoacmeibacter sp.]
MKTDTVVRLADYTPYPFEIQSVHLDFLLDSRNTRVTSSLAVKRRMPGKLVLNGDGLTLVSIALDGAPLSETEYQLTPETLTLNSSPDSFTLEIVTLVDPAANTALSGLY